MNTEAQCMRAARLSGSHSQLLGETEPRANEAAREPQICETDLAVSRGRPSTGVLSFLSRSLIREPDWAPLLATEQSCAQECAHGCVTSMAE